MWFYYQPWIESFRHFSTTIREEMLCIKAAFLAKAMKKFGVFGLNEVEWKSFAVFDLKTTTMFALYNDVANCC